MAPKTTTSVCVRVCVSSRMCSRLFTVVAHFSSRTKFLKTCLFVGLVRRNCVQCMPVCLSYRKDRNILMVFFLSSEKCHMHLACAHWLLQWHTSTFRRVLTHTLFCRNCFPININLLSLIRHLRRCVHMMTHESACASPQRSPFHFIVNYLLISPIRHTN